MRQYCTHSQTRSQELETWRDEVLEEIQEVWDRERGCSLCLGGALVVVSYAHSSGVRGPSEGSGVLLSCLVAMSAVSQSILALPFPSVSLSRRVPELPHSSYVAFVLLDPLTRSLPLLVLSFHTRFACDLLSLASLVSSRFCDLIPLSLCTLLLCRSRLVSSLHFPRAPRYRLVSSCEV